MAHDLSKQFKHFICAVASLLLGGLWRTICVFTCETQAGKQANSMLSGSSTAQYVNLTRCVFYRWLVGISYRVMFRRDPIPAQSTELAKHALKHVHGAVYICGEGVRPGNQPKASFGQADYADHSAQAYMGALNVNYKRQLDREKSTGMLSVFCLSPFCKPIHLLYGMAEYSKQSARLDWGHCICTTSGNWIERNLQATLIKPTQLLHGIIDHLWTTLHTPV